MLRVPPRQLCPQEMHDEPCHQQAQYVQPIPIMPQRQKAVQKCFFKQKIAVDLLQPKDVHERKDLLQDLGRHFCTCSPPTELPVRSLGKAACLLMTAVILQRQADDAALPFVSSPKQKVKAKAVKVQPEDRKATATTVAGAISSYNEMLPLY